MECVRVQYHLCGIYKSDMRNTYDRVYTNLGEAIYQWRRVLPRLCEAVFVKIETFSGGIAENTFKVVAVLDSELTDCQYDIRKLMLVARPPKELIGRRVYWQNYRGENVYGTVTAIGPYDIEVSLDGSGKRFCTLDDVTLDTFSAEETIEGMPIIPVE